MTTEFVVEQIDPHHEYALRQWWEVGRDATADRPGSPWPAWDSARAAMPIPSAERERLLLIAIHEGRTAVGSALIVMPLNDNTHTASLEVFVRPEFRREGIGTALLADAEALVAGHGRTSLNGETFTSEGASSAGLEFALAHGYDEANVEEIKAVEREAFVSVEAACAAAVADRIGDYRVVDYVGAIPDSLVDGYAAVLSTFLSQIPLGDLDVQDSEWTAARIRDFEATSQRGGRITYGSIAVDADGSVVGCSDVRFNLHDPEEASIGITVVNPAHRGHRLGMAMKVAHHRAVFSSRPECERIVTSNALVNSHMNRVNADLGYRVVETLHEMQRRT